MRKKITYALVCSLLLVGCSDVYKAQDFSGVGYSEIRSNENQFIVDFRGSGMTSEEKVEQYALIRAAEVSLENGFNYFKVERKQNISKAKTVKKVPDGKVNEYALFNSEKKDRAIEEKSPSIRLYIKCYKENPRRFHVINAQEFLKYNKHF